MNKRHRKITNYAELWYRRGHQRLAVLMYGGEGRKKCLIEGFIHTEIRIYIGREYKLARTFQMIAINVMYVFCVRADSLGFRRGIHCRLQWGSMDLRFIRTVGFILVEMTQLVITNAKMQEMLVSSGIENIPIWSKWKAFGRLWWQWFNRLMM